MNKKQKQDEDKGRFWEKTMDKKHYNLNPISQAHALEKTYLQNLIDKFNFLGGYIGGLGFIIYGNIANSTLSFLFGVVIGVLSIVYYTVVINQ